MPEKLFTLLKSRKFWAAVLGVVTVASAVGTGTMTTAEGAQAITAIAIGYMASTAYEDNHKSPPPAPAQ